jgi:UDP-glucose 4-epimerase
MILVTGGFGFQGAAVCETLVNQGFEVLSISRKKRTSNLFECGIAEVTDKESLDRLFEHYPISAVIHMVSLLATQSSNEPDQAVKVNVVGTLNLLEICRDRGIKRFVYGSSYNAVGYHPLSQCPIDETWEPKPDTFYGETKRFNEKLGISFARLFGLEFVSARMPILIGPGVPSETSAWRTDIFNLLEKGGEIDLRFAPDETIPLAHITDTADAIAAMCIAPKLNHQIYFTPSESLMVSEIKSIVEKNGKNLLAKCGEKRLQDMPPLVNCSRVVDEFKLSPKSLEQHIKNYQKKN